MIGNMRLKPCGWADQFLRDSHVSLPVGLHLSGGPIAGTQKDAKCWTHQKQWIQLF